MLETRLGRGLTLFLGVSVFVSLSSASASELDVLSRAGPAILAVIEEVREMDGNSCPLQLRVRRFVLGNPADYLGETISVCLAEDSPVYTLHFGPRAELDSSDLKNGDLIRFWPDEVMRPTNPIAMRAESVEVVEKAGGAWDSW
jgi:hypothetical protein